VEDSEILQEVMTNASQRACDALIELTLARGATDNVTVVVARYQPNGGVPAGQADIWE
jgi:protein phosphatase